MLTKGGQGRSDQGVEDVGTSLAYLVVTGVAILGVWVLYQLAGGGVA